MSTAKEFDFASCEVPAPQRTREVRSTIWSMDRPKECYEADQAERVATFNKIKPKDNWKMPINAVIDEADVPECNEAAVFFTGGCIEITRRMKGGKVRVRGAGYYNCIGA